MDEMTPLAIMSGKYTPNYYQGTPLTDMAKTYIASQQKQKEQAIIDAENLRKEQLRKTLGQQFATGDTNLGTAGKSIAGIDPDLAYNMIKTQQAQDIQEANINKQKSQFVPGTDEYIDDLVKQFRSLTYMAGQTQDANQKLAFISQANNVKDELGKYPRGAILMGLPAPKEPVVKDEVAPDGSTLTPPPVTEKALTLADYVTKINDIKPSGGNNATALAELKKIETDFGSDIIVQGDRKIVIEAIDNKEKALTPKAVVDVDKAVDKLVNDSSTQPIPAALQLYTKAKNAYDSANSAVKSNAIGAAIANFLYALRPEAVNEGDIELAKSSVRDGNQQGLKTVLDKVGMGGLLTTDYKTLAIQLGSAAYDKLTNSRVNNIDQVVSLLDKLDAGKVKNRISKYYISPSPVSGTTPSASTTDIKKPEVPTIKEGTVKGNYIRKNGAWVPKGK